jgi:predicted ATP-grasp superfamily ATP-dependent carboligase
VAGAIGYPVVLKDEFAAGGLGVKICADEAALRAAWAELEAARPKPSLKERVRERLKQPFRGGGARRSVQRFIQGRPAFHAVVAWQGQRLGGITAVVEVAHPPVTGPSCVVRLAELPEVSEGCAKLIRATGLTGFAGFDFMIEEGTGHAYILECNPRPTPVSHLGGLVGADLGVLFRDALQGRPVAEAARCTEQLLAFFPQELLRDPHSSYLGRAHLDFPRNDPALVAAFRERYPELAPAMAAARAFLPPGEKTET